MNVFSPVCSITSKIHAEYTREESFLIGKQEVIVNTAVSPIRSRAWEGKGGEENEGECASQPVACGAPSGAPASQAWAGRGGAELAEEQF